MECCTETQRPWCVLQRFAGWLSSATGKWELTVATVYRKPKHLRTTAQLPKWNPVITPELRTINFTMSGTSTAVNEDREAHVRSSVTSVSFEKFNRKCVGK